MGNVTIQKRGKYYQYKFDSFMSSTIINDIIKYEIV